MQNKPTLKEFLILKNIPFIEYEDNDVGINDNLLIPYEEEVRKLFPLFEFIWDIQRYRNEPNRSGD